MAFRFKLDEPIEAGLRRILLEQIERAQQSLTSAADPGAAVHDARKTMKRVRALLALVRPGLGESVYAAENARFRDIGRHLAPARDRAVLLETSMKLEVVAGSVPNAALAALRKVLAEDGAGSAPLADKDVGETLARLAEARRRLRRIKLADGAHAGGFEVVERGLERCYRQARLSFKTCYASGDDEDFHSWRKGVQRHWRHMSLLAKAWPGLFEARIEKARLLSQLTGDDHDLALLIATVGGLAPGRLTRMHAREIVRLARARQADLRGAARPHGEQLFVEKPGAFARHVRTLWLAGGEIAKVEDAAATPGLDRTQKAG